jgi:hypothetical protein
MLAKFWGFHSSVNEDSGPLGGDTASFTAVNWTSENSSLNNSAKHQALTVTVISHSAKIHSTLTLSSPPYQVAMTRSLKPRDITMQFLVNIQQTGTNIMSM